MGSQVTKECYSLPEHVRPSFSRRYPIGHEQLYDPTVFKQLSVKVQRFRLAFPHSLTSAFKCKGQSYNLLFE